jgi:lipopolysaccharide export system protein LptA
VVETTEQKGTYVVEKGSVLTGDRIIVYRKEPERSVKAFVLDLK